MTPSPGIEASGHRAVAVGSNQGIVSTGDGATIDARTIVLPAEALQTPAEVTAPEGMHNLPAPNSPVFVDRQDDLAHLSEVMNTPSPGAPSVVHGLGGTGKSTLALHFAHQHRSRYNPIWWIPADSPTSITSGLAELATRLNPDGTHAAKTSAEKAVWATGWLQANHDWLLVFDDADTPVNLQGVLGMLTTGRHLITSRRSTGWHRIAKPVPLNTLPADDAVDMMMRIIEPDDADRNALEQLAAELGYLPLALEQSAAYIHYTAITPGIYLDRLRRYPARMFATSAPSGSSREADDQRTIARIWKLSVQAIENEEPLAGDILRTFAWFAPDPIPRDLAYQLHEDSFAIEDALALLHAYSMITLTPASFTIHRLVQAVARTPDPADPHRSARAISQAQKQAAEHLQASLPENPLFNVPGWPRWRELLPHVLALTAFFDAGQDTETTLSLLIAAAGFLQGDGYFDPAIAAAQRAVATAARLHGPDAPVTLTARSFLASAHRAAGDLPTATPLHEKNVADCERVFGTAPETLVARANLAYLYALQNQPDRALELHQRNLTDHERVNGPDHPHTLNARANIASCYRALGDLKPAIALHQQSVTDYSRVFGPDHSETITARSNLAYTYQLANDFSHALPLFQQVLDERERLFGPDHAYSELARQLLAGAREAASTYKTTAPDPK